VPLTWPTSDTIRLVNAALHGLQKLYKPGFNYAKAWVMLTGLQAQGVEQADFFAPVSSDRDRLMQALDAVNRRFGRNTLRVGNTEGRQAWHMTQNSKTPAYTTDWQELPTVR
jgi:DNA polymerase V